jgi:hypothetical protein
LRGELNVTLSRLRIEGGAFFFTLTLAVRDADWPFGSFHRYLAEGLLPADAAEFSGSFG